MAIFKLTITMFQIVHALFNQNEDCFVQYKYPRKNIQNKKWTQSEIASAKTGKGLSSGATFTRGLCDTY